MIHRFITSRLLKMLENFPAVYLNGPRQAGKTTLVRELLKQAFPARFVTFDDLLERSAALRNPEQYLQSLGQPLALDEVQMVPDLFYPLKIRIDNERYSALDNHKPKPNGHYLLTGSANLLALPELAHAMVGRMATVTLLPLSAAEYWGSQGNFIENIFSDSLPESSSDSHTLLEAMQHATYPELIGMTEEGRSLWFQNYIQKITLEDPKHLYKLEKAEYMPILLMALATRAGSLVNDAAISRETGLTAVTNRTYRNLLESSFVVLELAPWHRNISKRLVKSGKIYFYDSLLLCSLLQSTPEQLSKNRPDIFGHVLENFVLMELLKNNSHHEKPATIHFYRTLDGKEVDFLLESGGKFVGIEIKNSEKITEKDLSGMRELKSVLGKEFFRGIILCNCKRVICYEENIYLMPFSSLWT